MIAGYNEFPDDVRSVFGDVISRYQFSITMSEPDAVAFNNNKVQIGFSINDELLNMSIKSSGRFYNVAEVVAIVDKEFYLDWEMKREAACKGLYREAYYKTYLSYYHILSDKYFLNTYETGEVPLQKEYAIQDREKKSEEEKYSIAWNAMQQLGYDHPIRQKYIFNDPSWVNDMLALLLDNKREYKN